MKVHLLSSFWCLLRLVENSQLCRHAASLAADCRRLGGPLADTVTHWQAEARRCHERARIWFRRWRLELFTPIP